MSSIYDPRKGGDPLTGKKVQVGIKIDSKQSENDAESWEEEESLEGGDLQSP